MNFIGSKWIYKNKFDEKEFIVGTSFPDIRYLNVIKRNETHFKNYIQNSLFFVSTLKPTISKTIRGIITLKEKKTKNK